MLYCNATSLIAAYTVPTTTKQTTTVGKFYFIADHTILHDLVRYKKYLDTN